MSSPDSSAQNDATDSPLLALTTVPDEAAAVKLTDALLQHRLAACVHRLPAGVSTYRWNGSIETASEFTLLIKSRQALWPELLAQVLALHPYDTPELIALPITIGSAPYLKWILDETQR
ncbi:MAG: divalent-cation tolerance protein CutA [Betaproteobacteria bacterium]|nr:divalent-cation tolerance protein CutA [Betaproteobacteria bacterium]